MVVLLGQGADVFAQFQFAGCLFIWLNQAGVHALDFDVFGWEDGQVAEDVVAEFGQAARAQGVVLLPDLAVGGGEDAVAAAFVQAAEVGGQDQGVVVEVLGQALEEAFVQDGGPGFAFAAQVGPAEGAQEDAVAGEEKGLAGGGGEEVVDLAQGVAGEPDDFDGELADGEFLAVAKLGEGQRGRQHVDGVDGVVGVEVVGGPGGLGQGGATADVIGVGVGVEDVGDVGAGHVGGFQIMIDVAQGVDDGGLAVADDDEAEVRAPAGRLGGWCRSWPGAPAGCRRGCPN